MVNCRSVALVYSPHEFEITYNIYVRQSIRMYALVSLVRYVELCMVAINCCRHVMTWIIQSDCVGSE